MGDGRVCRVIGVVIEVLDKELVAGEEGQRRVPPLDAGIVVGRVIVIL